MLWKPIIQDMKNLDNNAKDDLILLPFVPTPPLPSPSASSSETLASSVSASWIGRLVFSIPLFLSHPLLLLLQSLLFDLFLALLYLDFWFLQICREPSMRPSFTCWAVGTETCQIEWTDFVSFHMLVCTVWTKRTESSIVVGTRWTFGFGIDMEIEAVFAVGASAGTGVIGAFWHATEVVLMKEFATVALFTKTTQPMLTNQTAKVSAWNHSARACRGNSLVIRAIAGMLIWTVGT